MWRLRWCDTRGEEHTWEEDSSKMFSAMQSTAVMEWPKAAEAAAAASTRTADTENSGVYVKMEASPRHGFSPASSLHAPAPHWRARLLSRAFTRTLSLPQLERVSRGSPRLSRRPFAVSGARVSPLWFKHARSRCCLPGVHYHSISTTCLSTPLPGGGVRATSQSAVKLWSRQPIRAQLGQVRPVRPIECVQRADGLLWLRCGSEATNNN